MKLLLEKGVDMNMTDSSGVTPLSLAVMQGREAVVKLILLTRKADVNLGISDGVTPLSLAGVEGHEAIMKLLLPKSDVDVNSDDSWGRTSLSWAAEQGYMCSSEVIIGDWRCRYEFRRLRGSDTIVMGYDERA